MGDAMDTSRVLQCAFNNIFIHTHIPDLVPSGSDGSSDKYPPARSESTDGGCRQQKMFAFEAYKEKLGAYYRLCGVCDRVQTLVWRTKRVVGHNPSVQCKYIQYIL